MEKNVKNEEQEEKEHKLEKTLIRIIILIIIILLLIVGCSCTSKLIGKIGSFFANEGEFPIDGSSDEEVILNQNLRFYLDNYEMYFSDSNGKLAYYYENIIPNGFTCSTSDANIATCYVKDNYVVILPKSVGEFDVFLETKTNGYIYRAKSHVVIHDSNRYITLSSKGGTIDLKKGKEKVISVTLVGLEGKISVTVDDSSIADAWYENGVLKVVGKKKGSTNVNVSVTYEGKTYTATYQVRVTETQENTLKSLTFSGGDLHFSSNRYHYAISVSSKTTHVTFEETLSDKNAKTEFYWNGEKVDSLKDLELKNGNNKLEIVVKGDDGSTTTYEVDVYKETSHNTLDSLKPSTGVLSPNFQENILWYTLDVDYKTNHLDVFSSFHDVSNVKYFVNGKEVDSLKDVVLSYGDTDIYIQVTGDDGSIREYHITVHRKKREVLFDSNHYDVFIDSNEKAVPFQIVEDEQLLNSKDYDLKKEDITIDGYVGDYTVKNGVVYFSPDISMSGKTVKMKVKYGDEEIEVEVTFKNRDYYFASQSSSYYLELLEEEDEKTASFVFPNNLFTGKVKSKKLDDGTIRIYDEDHPDIYVDIIPKNENAKSLKDGDIHVHLEDTSSLVVDVDVENAGDYDFHVKASVFEENIGETDVSLHVVKTYHFTILANGGFFDEFTNEGYITKYEFSVKSNETFDLSQIKAYKTADETNCLYYVLKGYSISSNGDILYSPSDKITLTQNTTLYAIYKEEEQEKVELQEKKKLYLTDVDLFVNKDFDEQKVIYPGATGYYIMDFPNESKEEITITGITLEEDTICYDEGCLNMGYFFKNQEDYHYFGSVGTYDVLNTHPNTLKTSSHTKNEIEFPKEQYVKVAAGETARFFLGWQWVDDGLHDVLDTKIGNNTLVKDTYELTVSIDFYTQKTNCSLDSDSP